MEYFDRAYRTTQLAVVDLDADEREVTMSIARERAGDLTRSIHEAGSWGMR